jgi:hypothetical protein
MDDSFLNDFQRAPSPEFTERLRGRLRTQPETGKTGIGDQGSGIRARMTSPLVLSLAAVALGTALFTVPAVRGSAQAFLHLFRVVSFVAVPVQPGRMDTIENVLENSDLDLQRLIGQQVTVLADPGTPVVVTSAAAASAASGMTVEAPPTPDYLTLSSIKVSGLRSARVTMDTARFEQVLNALGINDIEIPAELNGRAVTIQVPPVVGIEYERGSDPTQSSYRRVEFLQVRQPIIDMPQGVDLATFGEIGLRILGVDAAEARRVAGQIDWSSTLVVPFPSGVASFRQVTVQGGPGLALETTRPDPNVPATRMIVWSRNGKVFAMRGNIDINSLMDMATSVQ